MSQTEHVPAADRQAVVEQARQRWVARLVDYGRGNPLLHHRPGGLASWEVAEPHEFSLHQLVAGVRTPVARLAPQARLLDEVDDDLAARTPEAVPEADAGAIRRLEAIRARADENFEETGLETMHLVYGLATWPVGDGGPPAAAPVVLVPVTTEASAERMALQRSADPRLNAELLQLLRGWGCPPVEEAAVEELAVASTAGVGALLERVLAAVAAGAAGTVPGFAIEPRVVVGNFAADRVPVVQDLGLMAGRLASHRVIAALAGDPGACAELAAAHRDVDPATLDRASPDDEFGVVDSDGDQRAVVARALAGQDVVVAAPPGTGKTQTVANLVAELVAAGRTVLVATGKSVAIEQAKARLGEAGLERLVLDLHDVVTRREFMEQFAQALEAVREATPVAETPVPGELARRRDILVAHARRMNRPLPPTGLSLLDLLGRLRRLPEWSHSAVRFSPETLARLDEKGSAEVERLLADEITVEDLFLGTNPSPWAPARLTSEDEARRAHAAAVAIDRAWRDLRRALEAVLGETRLRWPKDLVETRALAEMVGLAGRLQRLYADSVWRLDLDETVTGIRLGLGQGLVKAVTRATYGQYRRSHRELVAHRTGPEAAAAGDPEEIPAESLEPEVLDLIRVREVWKVDGEPGVTPRGAAWLGALRSALDAVEAARPDLQRGFPGGDFRVYPLQSLPALVSALAEDSVTVLRVPVHCVSTDRLQALGMQPLLDLLRGERRAADTWVETYRTARLQSALDNAWAADPGLGAFDGVTHDVLVTQFSRLDRDRTRIAAARLRRIHAENAVTVMNSRPEQTALVRQEAGKREGFMDPRDLVAAAGEVMTALKPCWMVSPFEVANQIDGSREHFDVVILDEANLLLPEEAVPALARARTCVLLGDVHQLPPRPLVPWRPGGDGTEARTADPGAVDVMRTLAAVVTPARLRFDHRSADERLVALSNAAVYGGRMLTVPAMQAEAPLRLERVEPAAEDSGETSAAEVRRVVELVAAHAQQTPDLSLAVVTLGAVHARRIEAAITGARRSDTALDEFCDRRGEPPIVRTVDRVQGDERDHCILALGFTPGAGLGPLTAEGGDLRLNVALTRARRRLTVVSAMAPETLPAEGPPGVALLRRLLALAAGGPASDAEVASRRRTSLERDVEAALVARGVPVTPHLGLSAMRIDLALGHPRRPGVHIVALEIDGPAYAALPTARDRDRLRREQLERLGWSHLRLWALEWYLRPDQAVERILDEWHNAAQRYDLRERGEFATPGVAAAAAAAAAAGLTPQRGPRPPVPPGRQITAYSPHELWQVITWVISDGLLRTDDEIVAEVARELAFPRVDPPVDAAIRAVVRPG